ncbi:hypothetical protein OKT76_04540 [Providencia rettgeri]|uniref:hypothetical protein n=1 Tax=Providencia rettgeri TaxID=587 RepID=UPI00226E11B4|nr:hypothetical protein [Providencia rettgeri]MCX9094997.1 hypothetical protein [Providencia rettgeri]
MIKLNLGDDEVTISEEQLETHIIECQRILRDYQAHKQNTNTDTTPANYELSQY